MRHWNFQEAAGDISHPREYEDRAAYRAYLFGPFRIYRGARQLTDELLRRKKAVAMLKWFLLNPGKMCSADEFIELLWPDSPPGKALGNFHVAMHCLRRVLEGDHGVRDGAGFIRRGANNFYRFEAGPSWWTDAGDVEMLFERAQDSDAIGARRRACFYYRRVVDYCKQGFLANEPDDLMLSHRRHYRHIHTQSLSRLMHLHQEGNEAEELLDYAYQMIHVDRCNEMANRVVVDALLQSGDLPWAQRRLQLFWDSLQADLGLCSDGELYELAERIQHALQRGTFAPSTLSSAVSGL